MRKRRRSMTCLAAAIILLVDRTLIHPSLALGMYTYTTSGDGGGFSDFQYVLWWRC